MEYDHAGRLIAEVINGEKYGVGSYSETLRYLYDDSSIVGVQYTNGANINDYYFLRNLQGDVIAIYDTNGAKVVSYSYDAYGNCTIDSSTTDYDLAHANPIRYRSYYYDEATKLYYLNARYYSPEFRRFISPDDTAYLDPESVNGLNLYCYCNNDPVNYCDSSGHLAFWIITALIGAAIGVGITAAVDYIPDKEWDLHWGWYIGAGVAGALIGAGIGMAVSYYATGSAFSSTERVFSGLFGKTTLYRSVSPDELADIQKTGKFNLKDGFMESKQFGLSLDETRKFGSFVKQSDIVATRIPNRILYRLDDTIVDKFIFKSGVVTVQSAMLNAFNNSLYYILVL